MVDHRELVAAEPRNQRRITDGSAQARGHRLQQRIARRMPERVVDVLEAVEIEHQHRKTRSAAPGTGERALHPFLEQHAIRQIGQRVMLRHIGDLGLGAPLLGDVAMRRHPAAAGHRLPRHADQPAVGELVDPAVDLAGRERVQCREHLRRGTVAGLALENAVGDAMPDDLAMGRAGQQQLRRQPVHLGVAIVADDEALLCIEHAEALAHVVDRGIQPEPLLLQRLLRRLDLLSRRRKLADDLLEAAGAKRQPAIREHADQAHPEHRQRHTGDHDGEEGRRERQGRRSQQRIRNDLDRAHRGEMMRHDRERQQQRSDERHPAVLTAHCDRQRGVAEQHAEHDGGRHEIERPDHVARYFQRPHPEIVHAGDPGSDHGAADRRAPAAGVAGGKAEAAGCQHHRRGERQRGEDDTVAGRDSRLIGQHGDEMRCPDAVADGGSRDRNPDQPGPRLRCNCAMKNIDGHNTGNEADQSGEQNEPPVMLT
ncbi:hypothetical protein ACVI1L_002668 [Bradyrhizobium sp. USDA 4516]